MSKDSEGCSLYVNMITELGCRYTLILSQYVSIRYTERLGKTGIEPSVGSVGDAYDNASAETINGLYKTEVIRRRSSWKTMEQVGLETLKWVDWFNNRRLLEPIHCPAIAACSDERGKHPTR